MWRFALLNIVHCHTTRPHIHTHICTYTYTHTYTHTHTHTHTVPMCDYIHFFNSLRLKNTDDTGCQHRPLWLHRPGLPYVSPGETEKNDLEWRERRERRARGGMIWVYNRFMIGISYSGRGIIWKRHVCQCWMMNDEWWDGVCTHVHVYCVYLSTWEKCLHPTYWINQFNIIIKLNI